MPWERGKCLVWDYTCPDTLAASHLDRSVLGAGVTASDAETRKRAKYGLLSAQHDFVPVAIETLGAYGDDAMHFIRELGRRVAGVTHEPRSTMFLLQRLSVAVQRGNAACILGTAPLTDKLDEIFYL
jgi:hypothetical protein